MPSAGKRKASPALSDGAEESVKRRFIESDSVPAEPTVQEPDEQASEQADTPADTPAAPAEATEDATPAAEPIDPMAARRARFERLKGLSAEAKKANLKEAQAEAQRMAQDPNQLTSLQRKRDIAAHKLLKAETAEEGEDFERKRAWDWTVEESEKWDRRMEKKERRREDNAFQDYRQQARKDYKRQMRETQADQAKAREEYEKQKAEAITEGVSRGTLDIIEMEDGELVVIDKKKGTVFTGPDEVDFDRKPSKEAVDKLVNQLQKAEDNRMKKRRSRLGADDNGGDVTYINAKNKQFNEKLARFYDRYTTETRESFERKTAL